MTRGPTDSASLISDEHSLGTEITDTTHRTDKDWVLFDGRCPMCRSMAGAGKGMAEAAGCRLTSFDTEWARSHVGLADGELPSEMALILADGRTLWGVDAFLELASRNWWSRPFAWIGRIGPIKRLLRVAYRLIADNRYAISPVFVRARTAMSRLFRWRGTAPSPAGAGR